MMGRRPEGRGGQDARERPGSDATEHFVEKWFQREPEMRIAAAFCARADGELDPALARRRFEAWGALLHELREAVFELPDAGVAMAKRGWWAEELQAIANGRARHPLGEALASLEAAKTAPWTGLGLALMGGGDVRAADTAQAIGALQALAQATLAVENTLFQAQDDEGAAARALAAHWLLQRLPRGLAEEDGARVPMHLLARHGLTAAQLPTAPDALLRDWGAELLASLPPSAKNAAFLRRARLRFDRARLQVLARRGGQGGFDDTGALSTLWRAWQAARGR
jgi:hypothetical protein